jgi:hypothetical protein
LSYDAENRLVSVTQQACFEGSKNGFGVKLIHSNAITPFFWRELWGDATLRLRSGRRFHAGVTVRA